MVAALAYIWILFLIPLFAAKDSKFARFHANQGLLLFILDIIVSVLSYIPLIGWIIKLVGGLLILAFVIIGVVNVVNGKAKELPLIGQFKIL